MSALLSGSVGAGPGGFSQRILVCPRCAPRIREGGYALPAIQWRRLPLRYSLGLATLYVEYRRAG
jgi:hypothetical protein